MRKAGETLERVDGLGLAGVDRGLVHLTFAAALKAWNRGMRRGPAAKLARSKGMAA
jgi:hypothetical protein